MSGRFVIKWVYEETEYPYLKLVKRFHPVKHRAVSVDEWEKTASAATGFMTAEDAAATWERLGLAKRDYVEITPA